MTDTLQKINELAHKERTEGLSSEEKALQQELRNKYREEFKANFRSQLDNTYIVDEKGNKTKLTKKH